MSHSQTAKVRLRQCTAWISVFDGSHTVGLDLAPLECDSPFDTTVPSGRRRSYRWVSHVDGKHTCRSLSSALSKCDLQKCSGRDEERQAVVIASRIRKPPSYISRAMLERTASTVDAEMLRRRVKRILPISAVIFGPTRNTHSTTPPARLAHWVASFGLGGASHYQLGP
jgi:hypothetical protein